MLSEQTVKKIRNKWSSYFLGESGVTGFQVNQHGVSIWLLNNTFRDMMPDSLEGEDVDYRYN